MTFSQYPIPYPFPYVLTLRQRLGGSAINYLWSLRLWKRSRPAPSPASLRTCRAVASVRSAAQPPSSPTPKAPRPALAPSPRRAESNGDERTDQGQASPAGQEQVHRTRRKDPAQGRSWQARLKKPAKPNKRNPRGDLVRHAPIDKDALQADIGRSSLRTNELSNGFRKGEKR